MDNKTNEKKNIMLVVPMLHQGGFERICAMTAKLLLEQSDKWQVYVTVFTLKDQFYEIPGVDIIDLQLGAADSKVAKAVNVFKRADALAKLVREKKIDVLYSFGETANITCAMCHARVKKIMALHSFGEIESKPYMQLLKRKGGQIISCAKAISKTVTERYEIQNVKTIWNPCDIDGIVEKGKEDIVTHREFFEKTSEDEKIIITMGREDDVKGYWHLLKAFRAVHEKSPMTKLAILGDGSFDEYKKMTKDLEIEDVVLFAGVQKNPFPYLKKSDVFVLSSISEGLPNVLVEAMAMGLPVVSVDCKSGPAEILQDNWLKIPENHAVFMADYGILTPAVSAVKNLQCNVKDGCVELESEEQTLANGILAMLYDKDEVGASLAERYKEAGLKRCRVFTEDAYMENLTQCLTGKKLLFHVNSMGKGGAERVISILTQAFAKDGYQVMVSTQWEAEEEYPLANDVQRINVGLKSSEESKGRLYKAVIRLLRYRKTIFDIHPDMVISFCNKANFRSAYAMIGSKIPLLVSVRNDPARDYLPFKRDTAFMEKKAAGCVFQTKDAKAAFSQELQDKSKVIWNPVSEKYFVDAKRENPKDIVTVGRITKQKNQLLLLKAFATIMDQIPEEQICIFGDDSKDGSMDAIQDFIKEKHMEDRVRFMGLSNELEKILPEYKMFVLPSDYEGMPNALMEAMTLGLPVISTDCPCGGSATLIENGVNGHLVPVGDEDALAEVMLRLLNDPAYSEKLGKEARKVREIINTDAIYRSWKEYVESLI